MKVTEIIEIFDDESKKINSIPKTEEGLTQLYISFIGLMNSNEVDVTTKIFNILMNKMLFDRVDLKDFMKNRNIANFNQMINMYYDAYVSKYSRMFKCVRLMTDSYDLYITHKISDFKEPKELDIKNLSCYIKSSDSPDGKKLIISYPIIAEILPILFHDMRSTATLERNSIMNIYALKFIDELYKDKKVKRNDEYVTLINKEINEDDDYFVDLVSNYDEQKDKFLEVLTFEIETKETIYNDINTFIEDLFKRIIANKEKDFIINLADIFADEFDDVPDKETMKNSELFDAFKLNKLNVILARIKGLLVDYTYTAHADCISNLVDKFGLECVINSIHTAVYEIYYSENFDALFDQDNDFGERGD